MRYCSPAIPVRRRALPLFRCWGLSLSTCCSGTTMAFSSSTLQKDAPTFTGSPDSIPSVADTSVGSSSHHEDEEVTDGARPRRLFMSGDGSTAAIPMENLCLVSNNDQGKEVAYGSEASFTSSETTAVATWNLSMRSSEGGSLPTRHTRANRHLERDEQPWPPTECSEDNDAIHSRRAPEMIEEDPPLESASCNGALSLTPRQLAEIFVAFQGGRKRWSSRSTEMAAAQTEDVPDPPSPGETPREAFLTRECKALKKIIQDDSTKIVNLKRAMEAQLEMNLHQGIEDEDRHFELGIALERIDALKKEKDLMREREEELQETIQILKSEVDKLSTLENQKDIQTQQQDQANSFQGDMDHGRMTNLDYDPFTVAELRLQLAEKEQTIVQLTAQVEFLQASLSQKSSNETMNNGDEDTPVSYSSAVDPNTVTAALRAISKRLEALETKTHYDETVFLQAIEQKKAELDEIRGMLKLERQPTKDLLKISENPDEVEVLLPIVKNESRAMSPADGSSCCCNVWSSMSDLD